MSETDNSITLHDVFGLASRHDDLSWQFFREGVDIYPLYETSQGCSAALLRYAPGARVPNHAHTGYEHILVLDGKQQDERGEYPRGTLLISAPESSHSILSRDGCVVLAIWEKPVKFL